MSTTPILRPSKHQMEIDRREFEKKEAAPFQNYLNAVEAQFDLTCQKVNDFTENLVDLKKTDPLQVLEKMQEMIHLSTEFLLICNDLNCEIIVLEDPLTPDFRLKVDAIRKKCMDKSRDCYQEVEKLRKHRSRHRCSLL